MSVEDLRSMITQLEQQKATIEQLRKALNEERKTTDELIVAVQNERKSYEQVADDINAELEQAQSQRWHWLLYGLAGGVVIGGSIH